MEKQWKKKKNQSAEPTTVSLFRSSAVAATKKDWDIGCLELIIYLLLLKYSVVKSLSLKCVTLISKDMRVPVKADWHYVLTLVSLLFHFSTLPLVILVDGLQAPNISGKDDLHHQIGHQSYESKNEFGIPLFRKLLVYLSE